VFVYLCVVSCVVSFYAGDCRSVSSAEIPLATLVILLGTVVFFKTSQLRY